MRPLLKWVPVHVPSSHWSDPPAERHERALAFVRDTVPRGATLLSIGCGDGHVENRLADSYFVIPTDLASPRKPPRGFITWNCLEPWLGASPRADAVIALGVVSQFNAEQLLKFFTVARSLAPLCIVDACLGADGVRMRLWDALLRYDAWLVTRVTGTRFHQVQNGYRQSDRDILQAAAAAGFRTTAYRRSGRETELLRCAVYLRFRRVLRPLRAFSPPYSRLIAFVPIESVERE
jgi:hypothetical protein